MCVSIQSSQISTFMYLISYYRVARAASRAFAALNSGCTEMSRYGTVGYVPSQPGMYIIRMKHMQWFQQPQVAASSKPQAKLAATGETVFRNSNSIAVPHVNLAHIKTIPIRMPWFTRIPRSND